MKLLKNSKDLNIHLFKASTLEKAIVNEDFNCLMREIYIKIKIHKNRNTSENEEKIDKNRISLKNNKKGKKNYCLQNFKYKIYKSCVCILFLNIYLI